MLYFCLILVFIYFWAISDKDWTLLLTIKNENWINVDNFGCISGDLNAEQLDFLFIFFSFAYQCGDFYYHGVKLVDLWNGYYVYMLEYSALYSLKKKSIQL